MSADTLHSAPSSPGQATTHATGGSGRARATTGERFVAALFAALLLAVLIVASRLTPSTDGHGTHTQLGLPACGWYMMTGHACPTCGMTTAFAHMTDGRVWTAFVTQPIGALLAIAASVAFWGCLHVTVFGSRLGAMVVRAMTPTALWVVGGIGLAAWVYKMIVG